MGRCTICGLKAAYRISLRLDHESEAQEPLSFCKTHAAEMLDELSLMRQVWGLTFRVDPPLSLDGGPEDRNTA